MKMVIRHIVLIVIAFGCSMPENVQKKQIYPPIFPEYTNVTIPVNIAPLNFMMRDSTDKMVVTIKGSNDSVVVKGHHKIQIPLNKWKSLLRKEQGKSLSVDVLARLNGKWIQYEPFYWHVQPDRIDPYLSYRLIEPGYEVWNKLQLVERKMESFDERVIADNNLTGGSCMNCHVYGNQDGALSLFHLRGKQGGTILNRNGVLRKIKTKGKDMISNAVYGNFHPSGRFAVFSTNIIIPEFHAYRSQRLEVYDTASDLMVLDFDKNKTTTRPFLSDSASLETFPVFSACGKWIYYCAASAVPLPDSIKSLKYSICRVSFDARDGSIGTRVDTLWNAHQMNGSASLLKTSPDGRYILYTVAAYGTFPIWHREADLQLMDLETGKIDPLSMVNGPCSDSYHSWSSNSRWFVFASKRDDGIYGKPYLCYIDSMGKACKPFVLPQRDPSIYENMLKSFNIPELSKGTTPFSARDIERVYWNVKAETVK